MEADKGRSGRLWMGYIAAALVDESRENPHALALWCKFVLVCRTMSVCAPRSASEVRTHLLAHRDGLSFFVDIQGRRAVRQSPQRRQMGAWRTAQMVKVSRGAMRRRYLVEKIRTCGLTFVARTALHRA